LILTPLLIKYWVAQLPPDASVKTAKNLGSVVNAFNLDIQGVGLLLSGGSAFLSALAIAGSVLLRRFQGESGDFPGHGS
jgi:hypothetical protein